MSPERYAKLGDPHWERTAALALMSIKPGFLGYCFV